MNDSDWFEYGPGVKVKRLGGEGDSGVYLLRMEPGACIPRDSHTSRETILVLDGDVNVSTWPEWPDGRKTTILFTPDTAQADIPAGREHELRANPDHGALLLTVARPDWAAP